MVALPTPGAGGLRVLVAASALVLLLAALPGLASAVLFDSPSLLKYAVTVLGPALIASVAMSQRPLRLLAGVAIVMAPFAAQITLMGVAITPLGLLLPGAALVALAANRCASKTTSALGSVSVVAVALLTVPLLLGREVSTFGLLLGAILLGGWLAYRVAGEPGGLRFVLGMLVAAAAVQAALALWEVRSGTPLDLYAASGTGAYGNDYFFGYGGEIRPAAALPDPVSLGNVLALACPLALALVATARSWTERTAYGAAALLVALALALTLSRMSWLAGVAGLAVAAALLPGRARLQAIGATAALLIAVVALAISIGGPAIKERFASIARPTANETSTATGDRERLALWQATIAVVERYPLAGTGFGRLDSELARHAAGVSAASHTHSTYLQIAGQAGLAGVLALVLLVGAAFTDALRGLRRDRMLAAGVAGALTATLVFWSTDYTLRYLQVAILVATVFGAAAAAGSRSRREVASS